MESCYSYNDAYSGDSTQLLYLRARYYNPVSGRFQTRDTWGGNYNRPLTLNHWMYVKGNPINYTDPTGHCEPSDEPCWKLLTEINNTYKNITVDPGLMWMTIFTFTCHKVPGNTWTVDELKSVKDALGVISGGINYLGGDFTTVVGRVFITRQPGQQASSAPSKGLVVLTDSWAGDINQWSKIQTVIHEMGHIVIYNQPQTMTYFMSELQATCTGGTTYYEEEYCFQNNGLYNPGPYAGTDPWDPITLQPGSDTHTSSPYSESGNWEDYAETFYTVVLEAYINSGDQAFLNTNTLFLNNSRYKDIDKRRDVMKAIIDGSWSVSHP